MTGLEGKSNSLLGKGLGPLQSVLGTGLKAAAGLAAAGLGALGAGLASSVSDAADFQQGMADIQASMGASAEETDKLKRLILDLGIDPKLKVSATEAAAAIGQLGTAGVSIDDILKGTARSTVLLANATGADFAQAASIASDVSKLWAIDAGDLTHAVDGITAATVASKFNINDYQLALAQAGGVASTVGVSFDDFNTTIAAISPSFASGSDAGTSFKVFLQRLIPQSDKATDSMKALGLITADGKNQFFDASGQMKNMDEIVGLLNHAFSGLTEEQKNQQLSIIFGTDAMRAAAAMAKMTKGDFDNLATTMGKTDAAESAKTRMDTLKGSLEILSGTFDTLKLMVGDKFLPVLNDMTKRFSDFLGAQAPMIVEWAGQLAARLGDLVTNYLPVFIAKLGEWWQWAKQLAVTVADVATSVYSFLAGIKAALQPVIDFVGRFIGLKEILLGVAAAFGVAAVLSIASFVASITPVIALIGTAVVVATALRNAWVNDFGGIREIVGNVIDYLYERFHLLWDFIKLFGPGALQEIGNWVSGTQTQFTNLGHIWDQVKQTAQVLFNDLVSYVRSSLPGWIAQLQAMGAAAWQWIVDSTPVAIAKLGEWATRLLNWVAASLPGWLATLGAWGLALFSWITDNVPQAINALTKWLDGMLMWGTTTGQSGSQEMFAKLGVAMLNALGAVGIALGRLALTVAGDLILNLAQGLLSWMGIDVSMASMHDHLLSLINTLTSALSGKAALIGGIILAVLTPGLGGIVTAIVGGVIPAIATFVSTIGGVLLSALGGLASVIWTTVIPAIGALVAPFAPVIAVVAVIAAAVYALYLAWSNNFLGIRDKTTEIFNYLRDVFTNFPATLEAAKNAFYGWASGAMLRLREGFLSAQNAVRNGLDVVMDFIGQGRDARMGPFAQSLYDGGNTALQRMGQGFAAARGFAVDQFNQVMTDIQNQGLGFAAGALLGRMYEGGRNFVLKVGEGIRSASPNLTTDLNAAFGGVRDTFNYWHDSLVPHFLGSAKDLFGKIAAGAAGINLAGAVDGAFIALRDGFNRWHDDLMPHFFSAMQGLGGNVISGLSDGIRRGIGAVMSAIQGITDALPQWVKDQLGIHSPSTVFAGLGQNIIQGLVQGMQSMAGQPQAVLADMTGGMTGAVGNNTVSNATSNTTNHNWNVTIPTSGGNQPNDQMSSLFNTLTNVYAS